VFFQADEPNALPAVSQCEVKDLRGCDPLDALTESYITRLSCR
jgi:hypothetical protein